MDSLGCLLVTTAQKAILRLFRRFRRLPPVALIVQKYGGTSVGSTERIRNVARRVARFHREGHQLVVVASAMAGETNRLLALAKELSTDPDPRELDVDRRHGRAGHDRPARDRAAGNRA